MREKIVAKNTAYQLLARLATSGAGFGVAIFIANHFGAGVFGDFSKVTSFVALAFIFLDFGLNASFLKTKDSKSLFSSLLFLRIGLALGFILSLNLFALFLAGQNINLGITNHLLPGVLIFTLTLPFHGIYLTALAGFQKNLRYRYTLILSVIASLILASMVGLTLLRSGRIEGIYWAYVFYWGVLGVGGLLLNRNELKSLLPKIKIARSIFTSSIPLGIVLLLNVIYFRSDILILGQFRESSEVGYYAYAYKFFDFALTIPLFIANALFPYLLKEKAQEVGQRSTIRKYVKIFLSFAILFSLLGFTLAPLISFFSPDFSESLHLFRVLILSLPIFFLTSLLQWVAVARNYQGSLALIYGLTLVLNIVLNIIFIPIVGALGAALTTVFCEGVILLFLAFKMQFLEIMRKNV